MGVDSHRQSAPATVRCAVVTVSDTRTEATDRSGARIKEFLQAAGHSIVGYRIVQDEPEQIRAVLEQLDDSTTDAVLINGGTGISRRDRTYEAVSAMLEKKLDGFGELFRMLSYAEIGAAAMLSRAVAGTFRGMVVFSMPGSTAAVTLAMEKLITPELSHLVGEMRRGGQGAS